MNGTKLFKLVVATALAVAALGATPLAQAGLGMPQKHPDIIAVKHPNIIAILKHPDIIAVKHPNIIAILKHPDINGVLKHADMRKAGGDK